MSPLILALMLLAPAQDLHPATPAESGAFEGTWRLVSDSRPEKFFGVQERRLTVENGAWNEWWDGKRKKVYVQFEAAKPWPVIRRMISLNTPDRQGGGIGAGGNMSVNLWGIYRLEGNTLTLALVRSDPERPLPDSFEPNDHVAIEVWQRDTKP